uniref:Uncharacterized protein n=1 Tax=viral metagenome TaxID=1070528 RepID=A0A6C0IF39_9ZZZZ
MSDTSDTSAIDDKKEDTTSSSPNIFSNILGFFTTVAFLVLIIIAQFSYGGLILYACKLAQSNILPTDEKCYPYTDVKPSIQEIQTNIFTTFTNPPLSMKLSFPYDKYNASNKILDMFRSYKEEPKSYFLINYFISIIESLISFNYVAFNFILSIFNGIPEILIVLFGPIIFTFISALIFFGNNIYFIYLWFAKMGWFFKQNVNTNLNSKPIWQTVSLFQPFYLWCAFALVILFCLLFWLVLSVLPVLPTFAMGWTIFTLLCYQGQMDNTNISVLSILQDLFKYYKVTIMSIFSFFVILSAFSNMGTIPGVFSILVLILIYFGIISINIFQPVGKGNLTAVVSNSQAKKTCNNKDVNPKNNHGLLYTLIYGQRGGKISNELKNLGKKLNNFS